MSAVIALQWPKNDDVLREYLMHHPSHVFVEAGPERFSGTPGAMSVRTIGSMPSPEQIAAIDVLAGERSAAIAALVREKAGEDIARKYDDGLLSRVKELALLVEALDAIDKLHGVELVVLTEDVMHVCRAAVEWARKRNVPSVMISHSAIIGALTPIHRGLNADVMTVSGPRAASPYVTAGVPPKRIVVTGDPAWDKYARLLGAKNQIRTELRSRIGARSDAPIVLFATTWANYQTTFNDEEAHETSLRAFFAGARDARNAGAQFEIIVKERPSNRERAYLAETIAKEHGFPSIHLFHDHMAELIVASDVVVSSWSNVSIEAAIAGIPCINIWNETCWVYGAMFDAMDGVLEAGKEKLGAALAAVLTRADVRDTLLAQSRVWLNQVAVNVGGATSQAAAVLRKYRKPRSVRDIGAWRSLAEHREDDTTRDSRLSRPHSELVSLSTRQPKNVLNFGVTSDDLNRFFIGASAGRIWNLAHTQTELRHLEVELGSIDTVLLPALLQTLRNPWRWLSELRPFLAPNAQILASIPNLRNFYLVNELLRGRFDYNDGRIPAMLDLRFFGKEGAMALFERTGYRITAMKSIVDARVPAMNASGGIVSIDTPLVSIRQLSQDDLDEFRTLEFLVAATPE